ncbi:MAG TPA: DUF2917 domain-containing protein [Casimicrobiaceae bacterium]|jgi:hypothetical protein
MPCTGYDKVLKLSHGELVELNDSRGTTVRVTQGTVWLTQEHDTQDVVLRTGDVWTIERQGLTLVEAQGSALVCVVGTGSEAITARNRMTDLGAQFRDWLRSPWSSRRLERPVPYY